MELASTPLPSSTPMIPYKPQPPTTLDEVITELHRLFESDRVDVDVVHKLLETYVSKPQEWKRYAKFDRYKYTRNLVDEGNGKFNLMLLCWGPSLASSIHDHTDSHCFMKILDGALEETRFRWPEGEEEGTAAMEETGRTGLPTNGVCYINDSLGLHRVSNPSDTDGAVSLHLYCPPFDSCQVFDQSSSKKMCCPVTFYSKFGKKVKYGKDEA